MLWVGRPHTHLKERLTPRHHAGHWGIRIESDLISVPAKTQYEHGPQPWLRFDYLTKVPFSANLINTSLLSLAEIDSINSYHASVRESVTPLLTPRAAEWLDRETAPLPGGS